MSRAHVLVGVLGLVVVGLLASCVVHHYDPVTGIEHIYGFGHMRVQVTPPKEGVRAVVTGVDTLGLALGVGAESYLMAGWQRRQRMRVLDENTAVRIATRGTNLFEADVGSLPPWADVGVAELPVRTEGNAEATHQALTERERNPRHEDQ